jgi:tripartite-type tricarboxylate transporter receptor subunit TctC
MKTSIKPAAALASAVAMLGAAASAPYAQTFPTKSIRIVLPVTPGGGVDAVGRLLGQKLTTALGQTVVIENRPGAGGNIAADIVAKAVPDGHTLAIVTASHATNPSLYKKLSYDPIRDFAPVTQLSVQPYLLVVSPTLPAKDVKELIALARTKQGGISYASAGAGLLGHLSMELLRSTAKFEGTHIPYKGAAPALVDVMGGRVDAFFSTITSALPQVRSGKVRALAVTSAKRHPQVPDVPTVAEQGYRGFEVISWYALLAPAGTPKPVVALLNRETVKILKTAEVKDRMAADGAEPVSSTPEELAAYIRSEMTRWAKVIRESGATAE